MNLLATTPAGGCLAIRPDDAPGQHECQTCAGTARIQFVRFAAPRISKRGPGEIPVVYVRLCLTCLQQFGAALFAATTTGEP